MVRPLATAYRVTKGAQGQRQLWHASLLDRFERERVQ